MNLNKFILKYELEKLALLFIILFAVFKIAFFKTSFLISFKLFFSLFLLIVLPGYFLTLVLQSSSGFLERIIIGASLNLAIFAVLAYYLNLFSMHVKFYGGIIPIFVILIGIFFFYYKTDKNN